MKPMLKYRGGKSKEIPAIMAHVPRFTGRYVEPFLGGGALYFHLEPERAIVNDINSKLMGFYCGVRDDYRQLRAELDELERSYTDNRAAFDTLKALNPSERVDDRNEDMYYSLRDMFNDLSPKHYSDAALYYYINKTAYSGMIRYNSRGEFNVPFGRYKGLNTQAVTAAHSRLLQRTEILNGSYADVFELCGPDDFVFLDPPYDCVFSDYGNEQHRDGFTEENHRQLARDFMNLPCRALMIIGRTALTEELYGRYITGEYDKSYAVNIRNRFHAAASHIIVSNYRKTWRMEPIGIRGYREYDPEEAVQLQLFEAEVPYGTDQ